MIVKIGNFFFHYRNFFFPVLYATLFIPTPVVFANETIALVLGLVIIAFGITTRCTTIGLEYIVRGGRNRTIYAEKLVTEGIYSICRNPMYLGNLSILLGFGIFANSALFTFIIFPVYLFIYYAIIKAEENFLFGMFGEEFTAFKNKVHALIPAFSKLGSAFKGYSFNWGKVVIKEYNSLFIYFVGLLAISLYRDLIDLHLFLYLLVPIVILYVTVKLIKKNQNAKRRKLEKQQ
jgi:protein-S-isoprenylcysteine O-methyltransferase Ste14